MPYAQVLPVLDPKVSGMCRLAYEGHPKGCPNYGQALRCPPKVAHLDESYDRIYSWRADHGDRCKVPDVEAGELG